MLHRDEIKYAKSGDVSIAFAVSGEGPRDMIFAHGFEAISRFDSTGTAYAVPFDA